jgi:hypothetical protein
VPGFPHCHSRANAVSGNQVEARKYLELAEKAGRAIADDESKKISVSDLNSGDWHGLKS